MIKKLLLAFAVLFLDSQHRSIAFEVNEKTENIGARRLYTVMEKLLDEVLRGGNAEQITKANAMKAQLEIGRAHV